MKDWTNNNVSGVWVFFTVTGGTITHINGVPHSGTTGCGYTDADGNATVTITRDTAGKATVTAQVNQPCGDGAAAKSIDVLFGTTRLVFCIDVTGSMYGRPVLDHIVDTVEYLRDEGVPLALGGVAFRDEVPANHLPDPIYEISIDIDGFVAWVNSLVLDGGGDAPENPLDALVMAKDMVPGGFIALATDNTFHQNDYVTPLTESEVIDQLQAAGCKVYIDPTAGFASYYTDLAVNGSVEQSLGQYVFPLLREAITQ